MPTIGIAEIDFRGFTKDTVSYLFYRVKKKKFEAARFRVKTEEGTGSSKVSTSQNCVLGLCGNRGIEVSIDKSNSGVLMIGSGKKSDVPAAMKEKYDRIKGLNSKSEEELQKVAKTHEGLEAMIVYANNCIETKHEEEGKRILEVVMSKLDRSKTSEYYGAEKAIGFARKFL